MLYLGGMIVCFVKRAWRVATLEVKVCFGASILASAGEERLISRNGQDMRQLALQMCRAHARRRRIVREMAGARQRWALHDVAGWARRFALALVTKVDAIAASEGGAGWRRMKGGEMHVIAADESAHAGRFAVNDVRGHEGRG